MEKSLLLLFFLWGCGAASAPTTPTAPAVPLSPLVGWELRHDFTVPLPTTPAQQGVEAQVRGSWFFTQDHYAYLLRVLSRSGPSLLPAAQDTLYWEVGKYWVATQDAHHHHLTFEATDLKTFQWDTRLLVRQTNLGIYALDLILGEHYAQLGRTDYRLLPWK